METELWTPPGVDVQRDLKPGDRGMIVNETDLPDQEVEDAVATHFVENAAMAYGRHNDFQTYQQQGSLLARSQYKAPASVIDEIRLARELAEKDDDIRAALGWSVASAFKDGMQNFHEDEKTVALFNEMAREGNFDRALKEMYREYLISAQCNTVTLFTRANMEFQRFGSEEIQEESLASPLIGVLPAEQVRVLGNDMFGNGTLAYDPDSERLRTWLDEYFDAGTSAARKHAMGMEDRVTASMFTGKVDIDPLSADIEEQPCYGNSLYLLNPRMVARTTMPKGNWKYPRPPLTSNFALLEAKRLLNIMDYALLQGGSNFIVIAKKGTDQLPAEGAEVRNLKQVVSRASKTGVIVGDHRLSIEILTPDLKELLNPQKRRLLGRKLAMALLRVPEHGTEEPGGEGMKAELTMMADVITGDRNDLKRHMTGFIYQEARKRNKKVFTKGIPTLWFPKVILQDSNFFSDYVLKLRDRGDIPRRWAVEAAGYPYDAAIQERQREVDADVDETMAPAAVPFSSPEMGPQDNPEGRPNGAKTGRPTTDPGGKPRTTVQRNKGETIKAEFDKDADRLVRSGVNIRALLEEYPGYEVGRIKKIETEAIVNGEPVRQAALAMIPVNQGYEVREQKALNLAEGLRVIVGRRKGDEAFVAKLLVFREPEYSGHEAEERAIRWGFPQVVVDEEPAED